MPKGKNPFAVKVGTPSSYKPEYCQDIIKYFTVDPSDPDQKFPTIEGFAGFHCGVGRSALYKWTQQFPEFGIAVEQAKAMQEQVLNDGLNRGHYKPSGFMNLWAKNRLDYKDKTETELSGNAFHINVDLKD